MKINRNHWEDYEDVEEESFQKFTKTKRMKEVKDSNNKKASIQKKRNEKAKTQEFFEQMSNDYFDAEDEY